MNKDVSINKREVFYTLEQLLLKSNSFAEILISFQPKLYKADTWLKQTLWIGLAGARFRQVSLYINFAYCCHSDYVSIQENLQFFPAQISE